MSLDVYLVDETAVVKSKDHIFLRENGRTVDLSLDEWNARFQGREPHIVREDGQDGYVYSANITHNMGKMASMCNVGGDLTLYDVLWEPNEHGIIKAEELISALTVGLAALVGQKRYYYQFNPSNGWGHYDNLIAFVQDYLDACFLHHAARIEVSR
jgi:hypothetical protein